MKRDVIRSLRISIKSYVAREIPGQTVATAMVPAADAVEMKNEHCTAKAVAEKATSKGAEVAAGKLDNWRGSCVTLLHWLGPQKNEGQTTTDVLMCRVTGSPISVVVNRPLWVLLPAQICTLHICHCHYRCHCCRGWGWRQKG